MSRGSGSMQNAIIDALNKKGGRASTKALMVAIGLDFNNQSKKGSFYRALNGLQNRGLVKWYKEHGGVNSSHGLVCTTKKNVLLIDFDSKIANLALMKISKYHKQQGHNVYLQKGLQVTNTFDKPDIVYISCIFSWNKSAARKLARQFQSHGVEVHVGGSGINLSTTLPNEIEHLMPDYDLYPECDYSLGYTSRGCFRNCRYCVIPKKEGKAHAVADIYEFYNPRFKKMVLLDPNIFAVPNHFEKISKQIMKNGIKVDFNAGLDIRLIDDQKAEILHKLKIEYIKFSWDNVRDEDLVTRGIEILRRNKINRAVFYVLVGFDSTIEEDLYRLEKLKSLGQRAYVMRYETVKGNPLYSDLAAWSNQFSFFATMTFEEFRRRRAARTKTRKNKSHHPLPSKSDQK